MRFFDVIRCKEEKEAENLGFYKVIFFEKAGVALGNAETLRKKLRDCRMLKVENYECDTALIREAAEAGKPFFIEIGEMLRERGFRRAKIMRHAARFLSLCVKYGAEYMLVSGAREKNEFRSPHELIAMGTVLGLTVPQAKRAVSTVPEEIFGEKSEAEAVC